ncbi:hypothetical protein [Psychroflexus planctonicus]|uniref:Uncharacterized protein n=1 Tax=Psychroflexus planctonicus TaxID=1526575 RepID=A0ABQ1SLJ6_9FLAO|nr:hypothetical protein [Psychroflexus planctonicus]GGE44575.1 hypothetical protein GCM10010832_25710 [Psychroflexus planctonicus]
MKKLVLTLVLGVFAFGASGFKSDNYNYSEVDCMMYQHRVFAHFYDSGIDTDTAWDESIMFYEACMTNNYPSLLTNNPILPH